jgi:hypothetical protein
MPLRVEPEQIELQPGFGIQMRGRQNWNPVLHPAALSDIETGAMIQAAKPLTIWQIMRRSIPERFQ